MQKKILFLVLLIFSFSCNIIKTIRRNLKVQNVKTIKLQDSIKFTEYFLFNNHINVKTTLKFGKNESDTISAILDTGVAWDGMALMTQYEKPVLIIQSRSGLAFNHEVEASNAGVVDTGYRNSIKVRLYNNSKKPYHVSKGDRIAQAILYYIPLCVPVEIEEFSTPDTAR